MKKKRILSVVEASFVFILCAFVIVPNHVYATLSDRMVNRETQKILAEDDRLGDLYIQENEKGALYFDIEAAKKNGESAEAIAFGKGFNELSEAMNQTDTMGKQAVRGIPIWGNWCGPWHGSGVPIDILDEGCKIHDGCYQHGKKNCKCNRTLINYIDKNLHRMSGNEKWMARKIRAYFVRENRNNGC